MNKPDEVQKKFNKGSGPLHELVRSSQERLRESLGDEELGAIVQCDQASSHHTLPFGGMCASCRREHEVPATDLAYKEAEELKKTLKENENLKMVGVLVCLDQSGKTVTLYSSSGATPSNYLQRQENPFCPPLSAPQESDEMMGLAGAIKELQKRKADLERDIKAAAQEGVEPTADEIDKWVEEQFKIMESAEAAKETPSEQKKHEQAVKIKEGLQKRAGPALRKEKIKRNEESLTRINKDTLGGLSNEARQLNITLLGLRAKAKSIGNFRDGNQCQLEKVQIKGDELRSNGQLGECAAPKLINQALLRNLVPVSIAEFWWDEDKNEAFPIKRGEYVESCKYCRSILGHVLCGLEERQEKLAQKLQAEKK